KFIFKKNHQKNTSFVGVFLYLLEVLFFSLYSGKLGDIFGKFGEGEIFNKNKYSYIVDTFGNDKILK
ncbi:MAG: hypothetical protein Q9M94_02510, partial [Candidatus Gracilibacteria bacterium]|nr:hypothetical protein [Candidatus Gracilibacteria bacterium]